MEVLGKIVHRACFCVPFSKNVLEKKVTYTRTSPPGAVGAVGHPFGQSRMVDRNALRALLSHGSSGRMELRSTVSRVHKNRVLSLGRTTFSRQSVEHIPKILFPNGPIGSHYVSAVKSVQYGGQQPLICL